MTLQSVGRLGLNLCEWTGATILVECWIRDGKDSGVSVGESSGKGGKEIRLSQILENLGSRLSNFSSLCFGLCCSWCDNHIFPFSPLSLIHKQRWKKICLWIISPSAMWGSVLLVESSSNVTYRISALDLMAYVLGNEPGGKEGVEGELFVLPAV